MTDPGPIAGVIRRLDPGTIAQIASGEMILRPASVAKELVENALDAGARRIVVTVRGAADRYLSVADDGCGMSESECVLSIERHATSKIRGIEDLESVATLGFRGEALPSIAQVSRMRVVTAPEEGRGSELVVRGMQVESLRPAARARGTTVEVEDLFFNAPVRKRFLRSPAGELRLIHRLLTAYALGNPDVDFRLRMDDREHLALAAAGPLERLEQIYGAGYRRKVLSLEGNHPRARVQGWVGIPELARMHTQGQTLLVNGRWVSHPAIAHALRQGFGDLLAPARQPFAVLILEIAGGGLDVNVHPTKREIRFLEESLVYSEVLRAVRESVRRLVPAVGLASPEAGPPGEAKLVPTAFAGTAGQVREGLFTPGTQGEARAGGPGLVASMAPERVLSSVPMVPLWQLQDRYIVAQTRQGILLVDQHAAHERILYEQALRWLAGGEASRQQLLFPAMLELTAGEREALDQVAADLPRLGIDVEPFGEGSVILRAVPATWEGEPAAMLRELLEDVAQRTRQHAARRESLAASYACHAAVRSGTRLDLESMNRLIDELFSTEVPHGDPHGRPTYLILSIEELDRRFGRA